MVTTLGLEIGADKLRMSILGDNQLLLGCQSLGVSISDYNGTIAKAIVRGQSLVREHSIDAIGVCVAGNTDGATILSGSDLPGWVDKPLKKDLIEAFLVPVEIASDGKSMATGQYNATNQPHLFVLWSTRLNVTIALARDQIVEGNCSYLQTTPFEDAAPCKCKTRGCLQANIGETAIQHRYGVPAEKLEAQDWEEILHRVAQNIHNLVCATRGQLPVVFGGDIVLKRPDFLNAIKKSLEERTKIVPPIPAFTIAHHGADAGLVGAHVLARQSLL